MRYQQPLSRLLPLLLVSSSISCSKEKAVTPHKLVGEWEFEYTDYTEYDADGKVHFQITSTDTEKNSGVDMNFTADGKYENYVSGRLRDSGTYSLKGDTLTIVITQGYLVGGTYYSRLTRLTDTEMEQEVDSRRGKEGLVSVTHAKKL